MIIKFDHISYSCAISEEDREKEGFVGYTESFTERELPNLELKKEFLKYSPAIHNITMLQGEGLYPIEITAYPECFAGNDKFVINKDAITMFSPSPEETDALLENLGFQKQEDIWRIKPFLDEKEVCIKVESCPDDGEREYLDREGFGSLAFVVDNATRQKKKMDEAGIYTTAIEELMVNGKLLKIFFAKSNAGDLVELIGMR